MSEPKWDPFSPKTEKTKQEKDPFTRIAIYYILGVGIGFTLICFGFIFFLLALLANSTERSPTPAWIWFLLFIGSEIIGSVMMYITLKGSPQPGTYPTR